jgi:hypothetical protein
MNSTSKSAGKARPRSRSVNEVKPPGKSFKLEANRQIPVATQGTKRTQSVPPLFPPMLFQSASTSPSAGASVSHAPEEVRRNSIADGFGPVFHQPQTRPWFHQPFPLPSSAAEEWLPRRASVVANEERFHVGDGVVIVVDPRSHKELYGIVRGFCEHKGKPCFYAIWLKAEVGPRVGDAQEVLEITETTLGKGLMGVIYSIVVE